jgi:hypothetical protein
MLLQDDRHMCLTVPASLPSCTAVDPFCLASFPGYIAAVVDKHCAGKLSVLRQTTKDVLSSGFAHVPT